MAMELKQKPEPEGGNVCVAGPLLPHLSLIYRKGSQIYKWTKETEILQIGTLMDIAQRIKSSIVSMTASLSKLLSESCPQQSQPPIPPPSSSPSSSQPEQSPPPTTDLELQGLPPSQEQSSPTMLNLLESSQLVNVVVPKQGLEWQNIIMAFCFTSALQLALQFAQPQSKISVSFCLLSFAILLIFSTLLVSPLIGKKFPRASKAMEKFAILLAATAFFFTIAIPFPLSLKCATWTVYAMCLLTVVICNCFY